nr:MAG TPA: hypothetical protein [Caudoviricetes sp.]
MGTLTHSFATCEDCDKKGCFISSFKGVILWAIRGCLYNL